MKKTIILTFIILIHITMVLAFPIHVKPLVSGDLQGNTEFNYTFNFTMNQDCSNVVYTNYSSITTDKYGIGYIDLNISSISNIPNYLCEYRNGVLRKTHTLSDQLFRDVYARNINITGYLIGNGSQLTDVCLQSGTNCPAGFADTQKTTNGFYLYNDTTIIYFNETQLNITIDSRASGLGDNESWNQSHAESLFVEGTEGDLNVNQSNYWDNMNTINATQIEDNGGVLNILESWLSTLFDTLFGAKDTDDLSEGSSNLYDNQTWNETYAGTLYADISSQGNVSWNESLANSLYYGIGNPLSFYNSSDFSIGDYIPYTGATGNVNLSTHAIFTNAVGVDYLANIAGTLSLDFTVANVFQPFDDNVVDLGEPESGRFKNLYLGGNATADYFKGDGSLLTGVSGDNSSWNETYADTIYADISVVDTDTHLSADLDLYLYNDSTTISFNGTKLNVTIDSRAGGDNASWNKTYADTLYSAIQWGYNQTLAAYNLWNTDWSSTYNETYAGSVNNASYLSTYNATYDASVANNTFNQSLTDTLYSGIEWDYNQSLATFTMWNSTWDNDTDTTYTAGSNLTLTDTVFSLNTTALKDWLDTIYSAIGSYFTSSDFQGAFDNNLSSVEGDLNVNSSAHWDNLDSPLDSWLSTYNATYDAKVTFPGWTNIAWINESNTFTPAQTFSNNITVEGIKLEVDATNHRIYDNATCVIITGDTSTLNIC